MPLGRALQRPPSSVLPNRELTPEPAAPCSAFLNTCPSKHLLPFLPARRLCLPCPPPRRACLRISFTAPAQVRVAPRPPPVLPFCCQAWRAPGVSIQLSLRPPPACTASAAYFAPVVRIFHSCPFFFLFKRITGTPTVRRPAPPLLSRPNRLNSHAGAHLCRRPQVTLDQSKPPLHDDTLCSRGTRLLCCTARRVACLLAARPIAPCAAANRPAHQDLPNARSLLELCFKTHSPWQAAHDGM